MRYLANLIVRTVRVLTAQFGLWLFRRSAEKMGETIPIVADNGHLCCDACGCEIVDGQESCENCKREINWSK